jgi:hypothetical protein
MADNDNNSCPPGVPKLDFAYDTASQNYTLPPLPVGTLDYSTSDCAQHEADYIAALQAEALNAAAGPVNVFPLLGVHNQGSNIDQTGSGYPLSSGTPAGFNILDAFNANSDSWRSVQLGAAVTSTPAFIGYSFGTKKAWNVIGTPQERYAPSEPVRKKINSINIKQGADATNRVTQLRVEASDDGQNWRRIDVVAVPDTADMATVGFKNDAIFNQWRFIPVFFNGVATNSAWEVVQLQLLESTQMSLDNIQDSFFRENRDRAYCRTSTMLKAQYDLLDVQTELAKYGINLPESYIFTVSYPMMIQILGRPVIVGDVLELPGEVQYDTKLRPVRKWLEVTDTNWSTEGYTFNWKPNLFRFYAAPILPSQEHKDLLGLPGKNNGVNAAQSDEDFFAGGALLNQQAYEATEQVEQYSKDAVPQTGSDPQDIQSGEPILGPRGGYDGRDLYSEDAIPPNGAPYSSGPALPNIAEVEDGHYHRQTYDYLPKSQRPPERLLQLNKAKGRWKLVEINRRMQPDSHKPTIGKMLESDTRIDLDKKI